MNVRYATRLGALSYVEIAQQAIVVARGLPLEQLLLELGSKRRSNNNARCVATSENYRQLDNLRSTGGDY